MLFNSAISFQYSYWWLLLCPVAGLLYASALYYRDKTFAGNTPHLTIWQYAMAAFRFATVTILAILLLSPFLRSRHTETLKPIVALINDNSESVKQGLKSDTTVFAEHFKKLKEALSKNYEVVEYNAGDKLKRNVDFSYTDKSTDLSNAIGEINDLYYNRNIGAVVLASDGIYNKGINPVYTAANSTYTIYTVALGDTTLQRDQKMANVYYNKMVYLNDRFAVRADVEASNLAGRKVKLDVYEIGAGQQTTLVDSKEISYDSENFFQSFDFIIPADKAGIAHYRLMLQNTAGEVTYRNNVRDIFVEVLDGRQKILLLAQSPHPDIAAFRSAIEENKNYQVDVAYAEEFTGKIREYNLIILHQLPSRLYKVQQVLTEAAALKTPLLFVVGSNTSLQEFNQAQSVVAINSGADRFNEVTASVNRNFSYFTLADATVQSVPKFPPMSTFFGDYKTNPAARSFLTQKINNIETDFPLWTFDESGVQKVAVITGEGIWRWRMHDFLQHKNHDATSELINKTIQLLAAKADKRPFRVTAQKNIFQDNEAILFGAELYNASFEPVNTAEVTMKIKADDGTEYEHRFLPTEKAYTLNAGFLPLGNYSYSASARLGSSSYTASGKFSVSPLQIEDLRTRADHRVLYQLASQHGGSMHSVNDMESIAGEINKRSDLKPLLVDSFATRAAIDLPWVMILLIILLGLEWFSRKYLGGY